MPLCILRSGPDDCVLAQHGQCHPANVIRESESYPLYKQTNEKGQRLAGLFASKIVLLRRN